MTSYDIIHSICACIGNTYYIYIIQFIQFIHITYILHSHFVLHSVHAITLTLYRNIRFCTVYFQTWCTQSNYSLLLIPFIHYLLGKGGYVFGSVGLSVCLSVCLFLCEQHYSRSYERIGMKFYGRVLSSTSKN